MTLSILRVMLLALLRDRGALAMAFVLPPAIYVIFASIFAGTTGDELRPRVAVYDVVRSVVTERLAEAVRGEPTFRRTAREATSVDDIETMVRHDEADVGILLVADPTVSGKTNAATVIVVGDSAKAVAAPIVAGQVQRLFNEKLPDAAYRRLFLDIEQRFVSLDPAQKARVEAIIEAIEAEVRKPAASASSTVGGGSVLVAQRLVSSAAGGPGAAVVYYAGAVAVMFLMFAAIQSAMVLIDERQNGILDRLLSGGGRLGAVLAGKFLFLVGQGFIQVTLIFALAMAVYGVDFTARLPEWLAMTLAVSACAAGFALLVCALCRTRQQAQTISNFAVLVLSALGGSMVPRFLMPLWLQNVSSFMPNAWAIDTYHGLVWRDLDSTQVYVSTTLMCGLAVGFMAATWFTLYLQRRS